MIIDSHVHVWVQNPKAYPWSPVGGYTPTNEASVESLMEIMDLNKVSGAVLVQPTPYGWDHRYLFRAASSAPEKFRCICLVDPFSAQNAIEMANLVSVHGVSGFRLNWQLHPLDVWQSEPNHLSFWKAAADLKKSICIQCTPDYFSAIAAFAERFAETIIVIDHFGRLDFGGGTESEQFKALLALSQASNIHVKISGLNYCSNQTSPYSDSLPFVEEILRAFGASRCLWGSDYPFVEQHWNYAAFLDWIGQIAFLSQEDLQWLLFKTARKLWW
jgi:predicted TIM-barrel fold metal-dependent hydrolase